MKPFVVEKIEVKTKSRKLSASWTMEEIADATANISDDIAKILQEEIDKEIMTELLLSQGWIQVTIDKKKTVDKDWCKTCIKKNYKSFDNRWFFEDQNDANLFALAWLA